MRISKDMIETLQDEIERIRDESNQMATEYDRMTMQVIANGMQAILEMVAPCEDGDSLMAVGFSKAMAILEGRA